MNSPRRSSPADCRSRREEASDGKGRKQGLLTSSPTTEGFGADLWVYVALGSNVGKTKENVLRAMERLQELSECPLRKSALWQTSPVDCPPGSPPFINAVVGLIPRSGETPESLLGKLQALEKEFGRRPKEILNEPRPLDLDLIAFGHETRSTPNLVLPHPRACQRRFVLQPLSEIAPELVLAGSLKAVVGLLAELPPDPNMQRVN